MKPIFLTTEVWDEDKKKYVRKDFRVEDVVSDFSTSYSDTPKFDQSNLPKSTVTCNGKRYWSNEKSDDLKDRYNLLVTP